MTREEYAKLERKLEEALSQPIPKAKMERIAVVSVPVSDKDAAVIAASLRACVCRQGVRMASAYS